MMNISVYLFYFFLLNVSMLNAAGYWCPHNIHCEARDSYLFPKKNELSDQEKKTLRKFPRIIYDYCVQNPNDYHTEKLIKSSQIQKSIDSDVSFALWYHPLNICEALQLGPQTTFNVLSTCTTIAEKNTYAASALIITHDASKELQNKLALINQMPRILADLCAQQPNDFHVKNLMSMVFSTDIIILKMINNHLHINPTAKNITPQGAITKAIKYNVANFLRYKKQEVYIYPGTVSRLAEELVYWVFEKKPVSIEPYNATREKEKSLDIVNRFPQYLNYRGSVYENSDAKELIAYAYLLENPAEGDVVEEFIGHTKCLFTPRIEAYRSDIVFHIKQCRGEQFNTPTIQKLADEFISTFTKGQQSQE